MTSHYSARAPFYHYFYWTVFLFAGVLMALILHRMIALASDEEAGFNMTTVSSYKEQTKLLRDRRGESSTSSDDLSDL